MQIEKVVINASPLILLFKSDFEWLLPKLFAEIIVPDAVWSEILRGEDITSRKLPEYESGWIHRRSISITPEVLVWNLGDGESEVLSWSLENEKQYRAVIDDRAARNCAKTLGVPTLGTGGILVLAKKRGLINSVADALKELQNVGLYISDEIAELIKKQAGEEK